MNTNVKVIGLTRLGIKPESKLKRQTLHTTWPSELLIKKIATGAGGLEFDSRAGQIGHSVANGSPPLQRILRAVLPRS